MRSRAGETAKRFLGLVFVLTLVCVSYGQAFGAARLSPVLQQQLNGLANTASVGVVIISFNAPNGLTLNHLNLLRSVGIIKGVTFQKLGMVGAVMTAGQVRALANNSAVRSIWSNDRQAYYMNQARMVAGVDQARTDTGFMLRNGGAAITGAGDFSVFVIDSGIDATHADLPYGSKVIQNTQRVVSTDAGNTGITIAGVPLNGFTPSLSIEGVPNTDTVGHGTHCAGIIGGLGSHSGGTYAGVAPGVKIVGSGGGAVILVLDALAGWEYGLSHQDIYKIRVISNSYGPLGGGPYDPEHPFMIAAKKAHDLNMTVVFAGGNDGAAKDTLSPYAQAPWVIGVAAGTKDGMLADFSSRGLPREERLSDGNPMNDNEAPTLTAPGNGRYFASSLERYGFTSDIVSVRASTNLTANGLNADAELPPGMIPFYTQISGTSMATPFVAGTVALMLDADPTLTPDEIKQILIDTATSMPGYQDYEVGAGYINSYAAVDKVFNRSKAYSNFSNPTFNTQFGEQRPAAQPFHIDFSPEASGPDSTNATTFTVEEGINVVDVFATVDNLAEAGTGNLVGIRITSPSGVNYSTAIEYPVIGSSAREITVDNPEAGTWRLEVRGARGLTAAQQVSSPIQVASPGPVDGNVTQIKYILPRISDIVGHPQQAQIEDALKNRVMDVYPDGTFRPDVTATREDLARALVLNTPLRQAIPNAPRITDVTGDLWRIAESVTANGSTLRDYNFVPNGMMTVVGSSSFKPTGSADRLALAVALVRALGHDAEARALAGQPVMWQGSELSDDAQIPAELRGYVQIALNNGLFEAYPAQVVQVAPGQFQALPGPRFEPETTVTRATLAVKLNQYRQLFIIGG
ncbi:MAG: S8 family serine peptidase [Acidobacteria bacterium]|nr:S8 family serine peptidase [Acidobacteriota bacterium]